jgi:hypothetical protein
MLDKMQEDELRQQSPERILRETRSLYNFKIGLQLFTQKHRSKPMTLEDYATPEPLAVRAYKDGWDNALTRLDQQLQVVK